ELLKALSLTPNHARVLLAEGECDLDLGNRPRGVSELEQAASTASSASVWNGGAYALAQRGVELDRAEEWVQVALSIETAQLRDLDIDHLTVAQLAVAVSTAAMWDTLGWIYFQRGDFNRAVSYLESSWFLNPSLAVGDHLAQVCDKLDRHA